jgi:putative alpha-1,2-mannosidase
MVYFIAASPGYFTTTFTNGIQLETTSTRRAGLTRFTYPSSATNRSVVVDLTNDLQRSFHGGSFSLDPIKARVMLEGTFIQSYGPDNYTAFACYDFTPPSSIGTQNLTTYGTYASVSSNTPTTVSITTNGTALSYPFASGGNNVQAGTLLQFSGSGPVLARFGVSMRSSAQACANAEEEVPDWDFDSVQNASAAAWENTLGAIQVDATQENSTVLTLLYSSVSKPVSTV